MQPFNEIEAHYNKPDPWAYQTSPQDQRRRENLYHAVRIFGPYQRLLDVGAGEGWITAGYPVPVRHGLELSNQAAARFPAGVTHVVVPEGRYDLVACTGIFYGHYNWPFFMEVIRRHASRHVLVCGVASWEHACVEQIGTPVYEERFPYWIDGKEFQQRLRVFEVKEVSHGV